jgi:hypothetical protein
MCVVLPYSGVNDYRTTHDWCDTCRVLRLLVVVRHVHIIVVQSSILYNLKKFYEWDTGDAQNSVVDLWRFDTSTGGWESVVVNGVAPSPRNSHAMISVGMDLWMYGGWYYGGFLHSFPVFLLVYCSMFIDCSCGIVVYLFPEPLGISRDIPRYSRHRHCTRYWCNIP